MSFFGSNKRYSFGVGVSKLLEDQGQDWWNKSLAAVANGVKSKPFPTGSGLVTEINKMFNDKVGCKFGHTFEGRINKSYIPEVNMVNAITDTCFTEVKDYRVGNSVELQVQKYMFDTYGLPSYSSEQVYVPYWNINGVDTYASKVALGFSGEFPDRYISSLLITLSNYHTLADISEVTVDYSKDLICAIDYQTSCGITVDDLISDNSDILLVDDNDDYLTDGNSETIDRRVWYVNYDDVAVKRYSYEPFFVLDYKRRGVINKSKYLFILNNRLGLGNEKDPCVDNNDIYSAYKNRYNTNSFSGRSGSITNNMYYNWDTTVCKKKPTAMFNPIIEMKGGLSCSEHKKREAEALGKEVDKADDPVSEYAEWKESRGSSDEASTVDGIINKEENKTVLFTHASGYIDDITNDKFKKDSSGMEHPQRIFKDVIDELLDVEGKYNIGFRPTSASGKKARSNFIGKGTGGYEIRVHDIVLTYASYFVVSDDPNDYGTIDKGLSYIGKDEKVARQCETRDERTGYSFVIDGYPLRTVDNNEDGDCESDFNDTVVQYMIPYSYFFERDMPEKYRAFKETACLMIQATQVRKLKWYETGLFKLALIIVQLYLSYLTLGTYAALGFFAIGILIDSLDINPYLKIALKFAVGAIAGGGLDALISTSNIMNIAKNVATQLMSDYVKDEMTRIREEAKEMDEEAKATKEALDKQHRDALYSPLDEINDMYDASYELLYESYGMATSIESLLQIDKKGIQ